MKFPPFLIAALSLLGYPCSIFSQAPANDDFANAQVLAGASASALGDNSNATLEDGEVLPGGEGGTSVWFTWTAPTTGWHTIHTSSANPALGLDTTIALFSGGTTVANTSMLGHNDESTRYPMDYPESVYPDGFGPSRLVFQATAATNYRIAVHGHDGITGPFEIHISPETTPEFIVTSVTFDPTPANISVLEATITATAAILTRTRFPMPPSR